MNKKQKLLEHINNNKVFSIIRSHEKFEPLNIAKALIDGGLTTIEISLDIPNATDIISELSKESDILLGACSVITAKQTSCAIEAGAMYIDTPVFDMSIVKFAKGFDTPIIMGASTANEAYASWKLNSTLTKIFPTKAMGGVQYISDILRMLPFLNLIASSGIEIDDFVDYLKAGATAVGIGKSLYTDAKSYNEITENAKTVRKLLKAYFDNIKNQE